MRKACKDDFASPRENENRRSELSSSGISHAVNEKYVKHGSCKLSCDTKLFSLAKL